MQSQHLARSGASTTCGSRPKHPILDLPLTTVIRPRYALTLQHVLKIYTVGNLLGAWRRMDNQKTIEDSRVLLVGSGGLGSNQARVLVQMGLGGFFMHSRVGLATPYLGSEWFTGYRQSTVCTKTATRKCCST